MNHDKMIYFLFHFPYPGDKDPTGLNVALIQETDKGNSVLQVKTGIKKNQNVYFLVQDDSIQYLTVVCTGESIEQGKPFAGSSYFQKEISLLYPSVISVTVPSLQEVDLYYRRVTLPLVPSSAQYPIIPDEEKQTLAISYIPESPGHSVRYLRQKDAISLPFLTEEHTADFTELYVPPSLVLPMADAKEKPHLGFYESDPANDQLAYFIDIDLTPYVKG